MKVSDKVDAEFINRVVFKITDNLYKDKFFYKAGLIILSGKNKNVEEKIKFIDVLEGKIDSLVIQGEMKKALVYTMLLKKRVNKVLKEIYYTDKESLISS